MSVSLKNYCYSDYIKKSKINSQFSFKRYYNYFLIIFKSELDENYFYYRIVRVSRWSCNHQLQWTRYNCYLNYSFIVLCSHNCRWGININMKSFLESWKIDEYRYVNFCNKQWNPDLDIKEKLVPTE